MIVVKAESLSESRPSSGKGNLLRISPSALKTHFCALFLTARSSVHPEETSVRFKVKAYSPLGLPPSWVTMSIAMKPGLASSQSANVHTGQLKLVGGIGTVVPGNFHDMV